MALSRRVPEPSVMRHRKVAQGAVNTIGWMLLEFGSYDPSQLASQTRSQWFGSYDPSIEAITHFPIWGQNTWKKTSCLCICTKRKVYKENKIYFLRGGVLWAFGQPVRRSDLVGPEILSFTFKNYSVMFIFRIYKYQKWYTCETVVVGMKFGWVEKEFIFIIKYGEVYRTIFF